MAALAMTYVKSNQLSWPHAEVDLNSIGDIVVNRSPRINAHAQGAIKFLEAYGITISDCKSRRQIYSSFMSSDQKINSLIEDLKGKLLRWKADGNIHLIKANFNLLPASAKEGVRWSFISLLYNEWATSRRLFKIPR